MKLPRQNGWPDISFPSADVKIVKRQDPYQLQKPIEVCQSTNSSHISGMKTYLGWTISRKNQVEELGRKIKSLENCCEKRCEDLNDRCRGRNWLGLLRKLDKYEFKDTKNKQQWYLPQHPVISPFNAKQVVEFVILS